METKVNSARRTAVLLEPHPLCHTGITALLARCDIEVVGAATTAVAAVALLQEHRPDLLVAEVELPEGREEALRVVSLGRRDDASLTVIVLSSCNDPSVIETAFERGASAYVLKTSDPESIETAVRQTFDPTVYFARRDHRPEREATGESPQLPKLTRRELEILQLVSEGRSNRQVAELLWVTDQTVKFHLANIYRKLGVRSRFDAARWAQEHGVLEVAESGEVVTIAEGNGNGTANRHAGISTTSGRGTLVPLRRSAPPAGTKERLEGTSR